MRACVGAGTWFSRHASFVVVFYKLDPAWTLVDFDFKPNLEKSCALALQGACGAVWTGEINRALTSTRWEARTAGATCIGPRIGGWGRLGGWDFG